MPTTTVALKHLAFGLGCFYLTPKTEAPRENQTAHYRCVLKAALEKIPNLNNVNVLGGADPDPVYHPVKSRWPSLERLRRFSCHPSGLEIDFDVFIPARIQKQLLAPIGPFEPKAEHFHVRLRHHDMPIVAITASTPTEVRDPATFVVIVREYLIRELKQTEVELSVLGPSPFHGDFFSPGSRRKCRSGSLVNAGILAMRRIDASLARTSSPITNRPLMNW